MPNTAAKLNDGFQNSRSEFNKEGNEPQFVTFQIGQEEYGIDIMLVQEIIRYERPTKVFNANPSIKGVMNFRGNVIPIIDMRKKFNLPKSEYDEHTVVIVIEVNQKTLGMIVDRVSDIISFPVKDIQYVDREFAEDMMTEHLKGMAKTGKRIIMLLDPLRVMSFEEYKQLKEVSLSSCNSVSEESDEE